MRKKSGPAVLEQAIIAVTQFRQRVEKPSQLKRMLHLHEDWHCIA